MILLVPVVAGAGRQGVRPAPAGAPLRRPRRQPAPHPDRPGGRRRGRHRRGRGRARDRPDAPTRPRTRRPTSPRSPPASASSPPTTRTSRGRRCAGCSTASCRAPPSPSSGGCPRTAASPRCSVPTARPSWTPRAARSGPTSWSPTTACPLGLLGVAERDVAACRADAEAGRHGRLRLSRPLGRRGHRDRRPAPLRPGHRRGHRHQPRDGAGCVRPADRRRGRVRPPSSPPRRPSELGAEPATVALAVTGTCREQQEEAVNEALAAISESASLYVERGYQADDDDGHRPARSCSSLGGVLMLGGTLTATFLALSDARPDLATLSAVGASPRTRRGVAAAYAVVVGVVGAMLGAAVGFIPGIAVTWPLTSTQLRLNGGCCTDGPVPGRALADGPRPGRGAAGADRAGGRAVRPVPAPAGGSAGLTSDLRLDGGVPDHCPRERSAPRPSPAVACSRRRRSRRAPRCSGPMGRSTSRDRSTTPATRTSAGPATSWSPCATSRQDEELLVDYAMSTTDPAYLLRCHCDSYRCRQMVEGTDWRIPQLQLQVRRPLGARRAGTDRLCDPLTRFATALPRPT